VGAAPLDFGRGHLAEYNKTDMIFTNPSSEVTDPLRQRALRLIAAAEVRQPQRRQVARAAHLPVVGV